MVDDTETREQTESMYERTGKGTYLPTYLPPPSSKQPIPWRVATTILTHAPPQTQFIASFTAKAQEAQKDGDVHLPPSRGVTSRHTYIHISFFLRGAGTKETQKGGRSR